MTQTPDPGQAQAAIEYCYAQGWSDGLPLVPASQPLVEAFLATTSRGPDEVIGELEQVGRNCTVYLAAVNAAMAGCLPEYFPVVLAAFDAVMRERAARGGGWQSTSGPAPMIVVNGPVRHELGFNAQGGAFGPEHAQMLAKGGYAKADVQAWLMEHCGRTGADLRRAGKNGLRGIARFADADTSGDDTFSRILPSPRHVPIVVAGARNAAISMVVRIFGEWSGTASPVESVLTMVRP
jgi:hypothetical protein